MSENSALTNDAINVFLPMLVPGLMSGAADQTGHPILRGLGTTAGSVAGGVLGGRVLGGGPLGALLGHAVGGYAGHRIGGSVLGSEPKQASIFELAYELGCKAAAAQFQPVAPPKPAAAAPLRTAATPPPKLSQPPAPPTMPLGIKPPAPMPQINPQPIPQLAGTMQQQQTQQAVAQPQKLLNDAAKIGEFRLGLSPDPKLAPGEIRADNGRRVLGTNFDSPLQDRRVSQGFEALRVQKNQDMLNAGNEASLGAPGV